MALAIIGGLLILGALVCFALSYCALKRKGMLPKTIAMLCLSVGAAAILSLGQLATDDEPLLRIVDAFYFVALDMVVLSSFSYAGELFGRHRRRLQSVAVVFGVFILVDALLFGLDVFQPVMVSYIPMDFPDFGVTTGLERVLLPLFNYHLALEYAMVFATAVLLIAKLVHTPSMYRAPYFTILAIFLAIVAVNVLYMAGYIDTPTDCSVMIYVVGVCDLYWVTFRALRSNRYAQVIKTIIQGFKGPVVCFGDNGALVVMNDSARELFDIEDSDWDPIDIKAFGQEFGMPVLADVDESCTFVWSPEGEGIGAYSCDFTVADDGLGQRLGYGLVMHRSSDAMDSRTGLFSEDGFRERRKVIQESRAYPVTFTSVTLGYVSAMNDKYGRLRTDASIAAFARSLQRAWPKDGESFISYRGASDFEVISTGLATQEIEDALAHLAKTVEWDVPEGLDASFEYGLVVADGKEHEALEASRKAHKIASYKLLASSNSPRSMAVDALVRPLVDRGFTTRSRVDATARLAKRLARHMGLDEVVVYRCVLLARLSDVGKVAIPDSVAFCVGAYTRGARVLMERHVEVGYRILKGTVGLSSLAVPLLHHHEHWDGSGYPDGLSGEEIPMESRVVAVASMFDELVSIGENGTGGMGFADAVKEIAKGAGTQYDPTVVEALVAVSQGEGKLIRAQANTMLDEVQARVQELKALSSDSEAASSQPRALVVDDQEMNRAIIALNLEDKYECVEAANGREAMDIMTASPTSFDVVLLDLIMPVMSGLEVLSAMSEKGLAEEVPVIVVTADEEVETWKRCLDLGAAEILGKPVNSDILRRRVDNAVELFSTRKSLQLRVEKQAADIMIKNEELRNQASRLERSNDQISTILHNVMDYRDCDSAGHLDRVMSFTIALASEIVENHPGYGLTQDEVVPMGRASALHDIGKVAVPDSILFKVGPLDEDEFAVMKAHTVCGYNLIREPLGLLGDDDFARFALEIVRSHHERWDGSGYPDGLKGREIPLSAQIAALADVYDALTSERPYKEPYSHEKAVSMILAGECGAFSDTMLEVFEKVSKAFPQFKAEEGVESYSLGEEYRQALIERYGELGDSDVAINNGASMEHVVRMLLDTNKSLQMVNQFDLPTGAYNRNAYVEYLAGFNTSGLDCMAAVYFDVNGLHEYNREHGHSQGDVMLADVAATIMEVFGDFKTFRTGGDEFVSVCENVSEQDTLDMIDNVKQLFAERKLSCSVGYDWRDGDIDMGEMVKAADSSMYQQKAVFYEEEAGTRLQGQLR